MDLRRRQLVLGSGGTMSGGLAGCTESMPTGGPGGIWHPEPAPAEPEDGAGINGTAAVEQVRMETNCIPEITLDILSEVDTLGEATERGVVDRTGDPDDREKVTGTLIRQIGVGVATSHDGSRT